MPYTPPSQRSPASSKTNSPVISRTQSYVAEHAGSLPVVGSRPPIPRSLSSTAYLQKHRRTPSISDSPPSMDAVKPIITSFNDKAMDNGKQSSPDSSLGSDEDEQGRGREIAKLHEALRSIPQRRQHSPNRDEVDNRPAPPVLAPESTVVASPTSPALTPEARKISHSRSTSEIALSSLSALVDDSPIQISDDSEEDLTTKPPLLRKKSGELVKPALRPLSRRRPSSMPGTPTFAKAVHFNDDIEQVRHFLQVDRPIAVSAGSSPVEMYDSESEYPFGNDDGYRKREQFEWDLNLTNFPRDLLERRSQPVRVERIFLSADNKTLIGTVAVANISFQKWVVARFTLDYWKTTSEVVAEYNNDVRRKQAHDGFDRFNFNIKLSDQAHLEAKTMLLCVRYSVNGQEYWDNNENTNYQIEFVKKMKPKNNDKKGLSNGTLGAIPRSRQSPPAARPRSMPVSFDDDFTSGFDPKYQFGFGGSPLDESPGPTIRLKPKPRKASIVPEEAQKRTTPSAQGFSTRYDFSASLSAALQTAQTALGDKSGLNMPEPRAKVTTVDHSINHSRASPKETSRPPVLSSNKPDLKSAEYNELIQKYCFFGSGKSTPVTKSKTSTPNGSPDNDQSLENSESSSSSGSNSPDENVISSVLDGASDQRTTSKPPSPFLVRAASPGPVTGFDMNDRAASPVSFGSPYHNNIHGGFLESHTSTAIRG